MDIFTIKQWLFLLIIAYLMMAYMVYRLWVMIKRVSKDIKLLMSDNVVLGRMLKELLENPKN